VSDILYDRTIDTVSSLTRRCWTLEPVVPSRRSERGVKRVDYTVFNERDDDGDERDAELNDGDGDAEVCACVRV